MLHFLDRLGGSRFEFVVAPCLPAFLTWVGGGLEVTAPARAAEEEAKAERERARVAAQPKQIGAKHILIMHAQSKAKPDSVTRSREDARRRAEEALTKIRIGADFEAVVKEYTDEPGGVERAGDLGVFDRSTMVKSFADAAFQLAVGQVSDVVETVYGYHIIKRTE
ncbi:MAG: peptidyl-prolyl cis-trans isomerase [Polyangiaceae bacterium]|nr:peptidyl-prolyl cis-trans isomerase [Polyangiaceae bacterium]